MKKVRIIRFIAILAIAAAAVFAIRLYLDRPSNRIEASGTIETTEVDVSYQVAGRVQELLVQEGDRVSQEQVISKLDRQPLFEALQRAQAQLESAKVTLLQQQEALAMAKKTLQQQQEAAQAAVAAAEAMYEQARTGPRIQELKEAEASLASAEAAVTKAKLDRDRAQELVKRKVYSQAALDAAEATFSSASSQRDAAKQALDLLYEGTRQEQIDSAQAQLRQSKAALAQATSNLMQIQIKERDVAGAKARLQDAQAAYNIAEINLNYGFLKAPVSGWVLLKNIEAGEVVNVGTPVVTLGNIEDLWMNVYVGEREVGRLRLGGPVTVRVDSYPNEAFLGKIIFISQEAEFTPKNIQTKDERTKLVYRVKVSIQNKDQKLKPGMPADAELVPASAEGKGAGPVF